MKVGDDKAEVYLGRKNEPGPTLTADDPREDEEAHFENFIECVRSRKSDNLRAPIEEGHFSTTLCHLGNISYRVGRSVTFDGATERFVGDEEADKLLGRTYRAPLFAAGHNVDRRDGRAHPAHPAHLAARMTDPIIRPLTFEDLDDALRLSAAARWNQRLDDWRMLLQLAPAGAFAAVSDARGVSIVGTAIGIDYGAFAWIAMMLVDPARAAAAWADACSRQQWTRCLHTFRFDSMRHLWGGRCISDTGSRMRRRSVVTSSTTRDSPRSAQREHEPRHVRSDRSRTPTWPSSLNRIARRSAERAEPCSIGRSAARRSMRVYSAER